MCVDRPAVRASREIAPGPSHRAAFKERGFNIVAVEADWPDAANIDRYVRHRPKREGEEAAFQRFPTWMWRNTDVAGFVRWLRQHNEGLDAEEMAPGLRCIGAPVTDPPVPSA